MSICEILSQSREGGVTQLSCVIISVTSLLPESKSRCKHRVLTRKLITLITLSVSVATQRVQFLPLPNPPLSVNTSTIHLTRFRRLDHPFQNTPYTKPIKSCLYALPPPGLACTVLTLPFSTLVFSYEDSGWHYCDPGARWRSWLRHCATSRNVAGSIPDGVTGIFH
jgi:hypothetical protein